MARSLVLVIEGDEWVSRLLDGAIRDAGYNVVVCANAQSGLEAAFSTVPDCIVCDIDLPVEDGYFVARQVRTHPSRVSVTPFLFLSGHDDEQSRIEGFHVGADVYITKPFRVDEVVAQIDALVQMAARLRARRDSMLSAPPSAAFGTAIEGDLEQMSVATVLTVLEMERRTGLFEVISKKRRAQLDIVGGSVIDGTVGGTRVSALAALRTMLAWSVGRFSFVPVSTGNGDASPKSLRSASGPNPPPRPSMPEAPSLAKSLGALLIEALRLEDEATRAELELPPSRRRPNAGRSDRAEPMSSVGPAFGGPASSPADFAPPSVRLPRPTDLSSALDPELADWEVPDVSPMPSLRVPPPLPRVPLRPPAMSPPTMPPKPLAPLAPLAPAAPPPPVERADKKR